MLRSTVIFVLSLATVMAALTPEEEKCVPPLSAKLEAEPDVELKTMISTGLGQYTEGKVEETNSCVKKMSPEQLDRFRDHYLVDECAMFRSMFGF